MVLERSIIYTFKMVSYCFDMIEKDECQSATKIYSFGMKTQRIIKH